MKRRKLFLICCSISILFIVWGCESETDHFAVATDGVKISCDVEGKGNPAVIFVHGWANNRTVWNEQVRYFSKKYKVVNIDLPGFGQSGNNRQTWTIAAYGEDVATVIKKLRLEQVVLVGFSMGAPVVIETAIDLPGRVAGVVLVDELLDVEIKYPPKVVVYLDSIFMEAVTKPTMEKMKPFIRNNPEATYERITAMLRNAPREGWRAALNDTFRWVNEDCAASLSKLEVPVVAINSDQGPTNVEAFRKYVPSFKARIIRGAGHYVMWDAPDTFSRLLEESIREFVHERK